MIENLSQFKNALKEGKQYKIINHRVEKFIGQMRQANVIQTNGCYLVIPGEPEHEISLLNGKRGSWLDYGKASQWEFSDGKCRLYTTSEKEFMIMELEFL